MNELRRQRAIAKRGPVVSITQHLYRNAYLVTYADGLQRMFRARDCRIEKTIGKMRLVRKLEELTCLLG